MLLSALFLFTLRVSILETNYLGFIDFTMYIGSSVNKTSICFLSRAPNWFQNLQMSGNLTFLVNLCHKMS